MVNTRAKKKANTGFSTAGKKLKKITGGAQKRLKAHYGSKYQMNTKKSGKRIGVKRK